MSKTYTQKGDVLTLTAPYDRNAGQGALIGSIFGVAVNNVANGVQGEFETTGCHDLTAATGAGTDWTEGTKLYWDNTNKVITKTSSGNTLIGASTSAKTTAAAVGNVRLNGTVA
jgi:predicted RecA/RadA family phage recombinase